jgi:hypothetical protein
MKKYFLMVLLSMVVYTASAQQLSSGDYTATVNNVILEKGTFSLYGQDKDGTRILGNYTIKKNGSQIASQKFTYMKLGDSSITLNLKENERSGNTLEYDSDTKKYELAGEEYKAKKTANDTDLILSGILIYAQWLDEE